MDIYLNRQEAGKVLARALKVYANQPNVIVLALPRGGVPVGFEIAKALNVPLDVFVVRKLGVPGYGELAMGAIATGGIPVFNEDILSDFEISEEDILSVLKEELRELRRREKVYRDDRPIPNFQNKMVILVDDGIATGASIRAAIKALRQLAANKIIVAVPVADVEICAQIQPLVDELICPMRPVNFNAVGVWYEDFSQTEDEEVRELLKKAQQFGLKQKKEHSP